MKTILPVLVGVSLALSAAGAHAQAPSAQKEIKLSIERQTLRDALNEWAQQTGFQLASEVSEKWVSPSVKGTLTPQAALDRLLVGTPLSYEWLNDRIVAVRDKTQTVSPAAWQFGGSEVKQPRLHLAQLDQARNDDASRQAAYRQKASSAGDDRGSTSNDLRVEELEEVVVTGTHIRDAVPAGVKLITISRQEIDKTGYTNVQDVLNTLTENWRGGTGSDVSAQNVTAGAVVNLRGLGADSTLVLIDGRRQASGGINGAFVDISSIAVSAIERIDVLPDGASAIYGSDAVGGVVNITLRKDYSGAETQVRLGTLDGDASETQVSQLAGKNWDNGNVLLGYQYYERDSLSKKDRRYTATNDFTPFGGTDFRTAYSNPGNVLCPFGEPSCVPGQPAYAIPYRQDGRALTAGDLIPGVVNHQPVSPHQDLMPKQKMHSAFFTASSSVTDRFRMFAEGRYSTRESNSSDDGDIRTLVVPDFNPYFVNPFGTPQASIDVGYNFLDDLGPITAHSTTDTYSAAMGMRTDLWRVWQVELSASYGNERVTYENRNRVNDVALFTALFDPDPATAFNPFGDGSNTNPATIEAIRFNEFARLRSDVQSVNLIADGALFSVPAGSAKLALGSEYREENIKPNSVRNVGVTSIADARRNVSAAFGELSIPLVGEDNAVTAVRRLNLSLAGRYEDYSDFGSTFTKKVGLSWLPVESMTFRGTWGTSFKAPRLIERLDSPDASPNNVAAILSVSDPQSPFGFTDVLFRFGGNSDLRPERAESWTAGLDVAPTFAPDLVVSINYFDISYRNRIAAGGPQNFFATLLQESTWSEIINRNPDPAEVQAICSSPSAFCFGLTPGAIVDARLRNLASIKVNGVDLNASKRVLGSYGEFGIAINGTYTFHFTQKVSAAAEQLDVVDTVLNPPALRLRGSLSWHARQFGINAFINYLGDVNDTTNTPNRRVPAWTTTDLQFTYETPQGGGLFEDLKIALSAVNIFDVDPPFVNLQGAGHDVSNATLNGRLLSLQIGKKW